ncbi:MAG: hypothetical protein HY319_16510 [Armatimonadetes bacterium]|nr:hypothetical protein [Armatimonadota bacterium]
MRVTHLAPRQQPPKNTPYQKIKNSALGKTVREHPVLTGVAATGAAITMAGGAAQSEAFANVARYGIVPAVAAGVATMGAAAVHDAIVNDLGEHNGRAAAKIGLGSVSALGGAQVVGACYDVPILEEALTGPLEVLFENGQAVLGAGVAAGGVAAGRYAVGRFQQAAADPAHRVRNGALGVGATVAAATGLLGGAELIGRNFEIPVMSRALTGTVEFLSETPAASVAGGAALLGGAAVLGKEAVDNFRRGGNDLLTAAEAMGAVTGALGGAQLAGYGLGLEATRGLLTDHADTVGSVALSVLGAGLVRTSARSLRQNGVTVGNSLGLSAGLAAVPGGVALAAQTLGLEQAAEVLGRGAGVAAGAGLGLAAYAFGQRAVDSAREGRPLSAVFHGSMAAASATTSLWAVGESLGIEAISRVGERIAEHTLEPLFEHVIAPTAEFLFENPVAGAVLLAVGVGGYLYWRSRGKDEEPAPPGEGKPTG